MLSPTCGTAGEIATSKTCGGLFTAIKAAAGPDPGPRLPPMSVALTL